MGWSVGYDTNWQRDIGYGVPGLCDFPACDAVITRGIDNVCGGEAYGGEDGCGLYFCSEHLKIGERRWGPFCARCHPSNPHSRRCKSFKPSPEVREWIAHKLTDASWGKWRAANRAEVKLLRAKLDEFISVGEKALS